MADALDWVDMLQEDGSTYKSNLCALFSANRDYLLEELPKIKGIPWKPLPCEGGYFLMVDISECEAIIPELYKTTHDYEEGVNKYRLQMPSGGIPLDLAFCRWCAVEKGVAMMPNSFFY